MTNLNWPSITSIGEITPILDTNPDFKVTDKEGYSVVDYKVQKLDTFLSDPLFLDLRGIKFDEEGYIIARPLPKIHNIGEPGSVETSTPNDFKVFEKFDGSMIHTVMLDGSLRFMTRSGITEQSLLAEELFLDQIDEDVISMVENGFTFCYEFVGPSNKHVVDYEQDSLFLLCCRHNITGEFYIEGMLDIKSRVFNDNKFIPIKKDRLEEGFIIFYKDGVIKKTKFPEFVKLHGNKALVERDSGKLKLLASDQHDDVIAQLDEKSQRSFEEFIRRVICVWDELYDKFINIIEVVESTLGEGKEVTRKDFAIAAKDNLPSEVLSLFFSFLDDLGGEDKPQIMNFYEKLLRSCKGPSGKCELLEKLEGVFTQ